MDYHRANDDGRTAAVLGVIALLGFAIVSWMVEAHVGTAFDAAVQRWTLAHQSSTVRVVFRGITTLGGITGMRVVALVGAAYIWIRVRGWTGPALLIVPFVADILFHIAKRVEARARPLGLGDGVDTSYSFPSGHATVSAAVCGALAYAMFREGLIGGSAAVTIALLVPLLVGISRVYLNVHWATDVLGGWCAGLCVAAIWTTAYALVRGGRD